MRSTGSGPLGALLMLAPLIAVPILAVVGIPQFAPGNLIDPDGSGKARTSARERRVVEDDVGEDVAAGADDLFSPLEERAGLSEFSDPLENTGRRVGNSRRRSDRSRSRADLIEPPDETDDSRPSGRDESFDFENEQDAEAYPGSPGRRSRTQEDTKQRKPAPGSDNGSGTFGGQIRSNSFEESPTDELGVSTNEPPADEDAGDELEKFEKGSHRSSQGTPGRRRRPAPQDSLDAPRFVPPGESDSEASEAVEGEKFADRSTVDELPSRRNPPPLNQDTRSEEQPEVDVLPEEAIENPPGVDNLTWKAASKRLRSLGVAEGKHYFTYLENRELFLFTCEASHPDKTPARKRFQAEAEDPLLAVRQVLTELEAWHSTKTAPRARSSRGARYEDL